MASWTPLNVEPESDAEEEEYDDTKEIQIEEAVKLYNSALKLHAQGPAYFDEAEKAYKALFESEIFTWPESKSQYERLTGQVPVEESEDLEGEESDRSVLSLSRQDSAPNTLPQVLYLSFKNRGQFFLDRLIHQKAHFQASTMASDWEKIANKPEEITRESLDLLVAALDKDESDPLLWRKIARIGNHLGSRRLARYALESALAAKSSEETAVLGGMGLEEMSIREELADVLRSIGEDEALIKSILPKKPLSAELKAKLDPFPSIKPAPVIPMSQLTKPLESITLKPEEATWESVGRAFEIAFTREFDGTEDRPGLSYKLDLPAITGENRSIVNTAQVVSPEVLSKSRLSQSPTSPMKHSLFETAATAAAQITSPKLRRKSFGPNAENDARPIMAGDGEDAEHNETKSQDKTTDTADPVSSEQRPPSKRDSEAAGLRDPPEGGRSRSKRLRARAETLAEENTDPQAMMKYYEEKLLQYVHADEWIFSVVFEISSKVGVKQPGDPLAFRSFLSTNADTNNLANHPDAIVASLVDFKHCLCNWNLNKSNLLLNGIGSGASATLIDNGADSGFAAFLEHAKAGTKRTASSEDYLLGQDLHSLVEMLNSQWILIDNAVFWWMVFLLKPTWEDKPTSNACANFRSKYTTYIWSTSLKALLTRLLVSNDEHIYKKLWDFWSPFEEHPARTNPLRNELDDGEMASIQFVQTVFELHVDIYGKMTGPDSKVDQPTRVSQRWRMGRWARLSNLAVSRWDLLDGFNGKATHLALRHLWAYVVYISFIEPASREHILLLYQSLKEQLEEKGSPVYKLHNNAVMPEVSVQALEREMSREKTMDFFSSIFGANAENPVALIRSLEPVLTETLATAGKVGRQMAAETEMRDSQEEDAIKQDANSAADTARGESKNGNEQLIEFLQKTNAQLRLSLWHQLKTAYDSIDYPPMKLMCNIRSMEIILNELKSAAYLNDSPDERSANLIVWIRNLADLITECLEMTRTNSNALDFIAEDGIVVAVSTCIDVVKLFHVFAVWEDSVRIEQTKPPHQPQGAVVAGKSAMTFLREMQPKVWQFLYLVCVDAATQYREVFPALSEDRLEYLRAIHNAFGMREYCRLGRKNLLKFMKTELIQLDAPENEVSQVLHDLYNLKICQNGTNIVDHGCTGDQIDRASALEIVPFVIVQTDRMNIKDVLKSDVKVATEKMQAVIGIPRGSSTQQAFNKRVVLNHLKSPIVPANLFKALRGLAELNSVRVDTEYATVAKKGWFFLIGHINLTKYRSQKRVGPDNSDDLDDAEKFLRLDLEFNMDNWETWYRLAQTFDAKIEESVTWDAGEINDSESELISHQRFAIHCYEMAMSLALRYASTTFETASKISDLYSDFATRIYSSSRAPFNMEAFSLKSYERFMNRADIGTFKQQPYTEIKHHVAWKLASELYRMALAGKSDSWIHWYMLGKCLWKLFRSPNASSTGWREPVDAFIKAVQCVPEKKDSRHPEKDPILDSHYKLLSVVYKLVQERHISHEEGIHILQNSHFARKVSPGDANGWKDYVAQVLKMLRTADKSNWHHRMVARAAHIVYDDNPQDQDAAQAAKEKLTQQIFTKSMMMQVWKPEFERPGRHFVYASRYVRFFVRLLEQLGDRMSLEALGKRIRKKQNDFIGHEVIWKETSHAHLRLLRIQGNILANYEEMVFKHTIPFEVFTLNANRLETWAHSQLSLGHPTLLLLQEAIELKKLNGTLIDKVPFDDLIGDLYARIYEQVVPELIAKAGEAENRERMRIERMLMDSESSQPGPEKGENAPTSGRTKTISRTEVRRRAEALVMRPGAMTGRGKGATAAAEQASTPRDRRKSEAKPLPADVQAVQSEAENAGSLQDSADDESELTDIEEEEEEEGEEEAEEEQRNLLFPGLAPQGDTESRDRTVSAEPEDADEEQEAAGEGQQDGELEGEGEAEQGDEMEGVAAS